jgi:hypothetical protein
MSSGTCSESFFSAFEMLPVLRLIHNQYKRETTDTTAQLCTQKNVTDQRRLLYIYILITCLLVARFLH